MKLAIQSKSSQQAKNVNSTAYTDMEDGQAFGKLIKRHPEDISDVLCEQYQRDFLTKNAADVQHRVKQEEADQKYKNNLKRSQFVKFINRSRLK